MFRLCLALILALPALPLAAGDCDTGIAHLEGGYTVGAMGSTMIYAQELRLERNGPGLTGRWTGTRHRQVITFSPPATPVAPTDPVTNLPGVEATCTTEVRAMTVDIICEGIYPFTLHKDWTITWEGQSNVIGSYAPAGNTALGQITIDMLTGTPNYGMALAMGMTGAVSGPVELGLNGDLDVSITALPTPVTTLPNARAYRFSAEIDPPAPSATLNLIGFAGAKPIGEALVTMGPTPSMIDVTFYGGAPGDHRKQAANLTLTATATFRDCTRTKSLRAADLFAAIGMSP